MIRVDKRRTAFRVWSGLANNTAVQCGVHAVASVGMSLSPSSRLHVAGLYQHCSSVSWLHVRLAHNTLYRCRNKVREDMKMKQTVWASIKLRVQMENNYIDKDIYGWCHTDIKICYATGILRNHTSLSKKCCLGVARLILLGSWLDMCGLLVGVSITG
jgi:hypothetical protein